MLPPETERVWNFLQTLHSLSGAVLIGGSALALRLNHRLSEDLDIVFLRETLPRSLDALPVEALQKGLSFTAKDDPAALEEFTSGGLELRDFQQDFVVDQRVKVSFFTADEAMVRILREPPAESVRIGTLAELFKSKALVSAKRSKSRDWLDLYLLIKNHGFTLRDYREAFREAGIASQYEIGLSRLCSGVPQRDDEGFSHLLQHSPTVEQMKVFFVQKREQFEVEVAAEERSRRPL